MSIPSSLHVKPRKYAGDCLRESKYGRGLSLGRERVGGYASRSIQTGTSCSSHPVRAENGLLRL